MGLRLWGMFNKIIFYKKGKYYRDWHRNLDPKKRNSFGLGIFPKGNTPVKVKIKDWGCTVLDSDKARVWGFRISSEKTTIKGYKI